MLGAHYVSPLYQANATYVRSRICVGLVADQRRNDLVQW